MLVKEMFYNVSIFITFFVILILNASASEKDKIIENLKNRIILFKKELSIFFAAIVFFAFLYFIL